MDFENNKQRQAALASRRYLGAQEMLRAFLPGMLMLVSQHDVQHDGKETPRKEMSGRQVFGVLFVTTVAILSFAAYMPLPRW